jgi:hypothetical protein
MELKITVLNAFDSRFKCCFDFLSGLKSQSVKDSLSSLQAGWIPIYRCPKCSKVWQRKNSEWVLLKPVESNNG